MYNNYLFSKENSHQQVPNKMYENQFKLQTLDKPKNVAKMTKSICVAIDSRYRNTDKYVDPVKFSVNFYSGNTDIENIVQRKIRNITSIRLVECILPKITVTYPYIVLVIPELKNELESNSEILNKAFCVLLPDKTYGEFLHCRVSDMCNCFKKFSPPLSSINKLTFEFYTPDNELLSLDGADEDNNIMMMFEIKTKAANTSELMDEVYLNY